MHNATSLCGFQSDPGGVSATPGARLGSTRCTHAGHGSRASTCVDDSRNSHSRTRCQYLPKRVVTIACPWPLPLTGTSSNFYLNVTKFEELRETDIRPRANAVPIKKTQPVTAQMHSARSNMFTSK